MSTGYKVGWTWHPQWRLYGESIAGIIFRIAFANVLSPRLMKALISPSSTLPPIGSALYQSRNGQTGFERIGSGIGVSEAVLRTALLGDLLESLCWTPVLSQRFRFCPDCLRCGYHARYFQIMALAACPIHRTLIQDTCPVCAAPTPFYGACLDLFRTPYCCWKCNAYYSGNRVTIRTFFEPEMTFEELRKEWKPLDDWIESLNRLDLAFGMLREWVFDTQGDSRQIREIDALHVVATVLPLPGTPFMWAAPSMRRKAIFYFEGGRKPRAEVVIGNYLADAYFQVRQGIEVKLTKARVTELVRHCRHDSWAALCSDRLKVLSIKEVAYVLWRMHFEHLSEPALLEMADRARVFISEDTIPFPWWNLGKPAWKIVLWAAYRGIVHDVECAIQNGDHVADLLRLPPTRHCCILPSTSIRGNGRGVIAYPMPLLL